MKFKRLAVVVLVLFTAADYSQRDPDCDTVVVPQTRIALYLFYPWQ